MYLGKSFQTILEKHETNPIDYDEAIRSYDIILWQRTMEAGLESMHSNGVQV